MQMSLAAGILVSVLLGPVIGLAVASWMFPDGEFPIYVIAGLAGAYHLIRTLWKCEFIRPEHCNE